MSVAGTYKITINSPMGAQEATLRLNDDGSGNMAGAQGSQDLAEVAIDGSSASWSTEIQQPMPMKLEFTATVDGDNISGDVKAGAFGSFPFSGAKA